MSAMMANFIYFLSHNFESAKVASRLAPMHVFMPDASRQPGVANGCAKRFQFRSGSFRHEFNAPSGQIAHGARHFKTGGDLLDRKPKTDALHVARVKNVHPVPVHGAQGFGDNGPGQVAARPIPARPPVFAWGDKAKAGAATQRFSRRFRLVNRAGAAPGVWPPANGSWWWVVPEAWVLLPPRAPRRPRAAFRAWRGPPTWLPRRLARAGTIPGARPPR